MADIRRFQTRQQLVDETMEEGEAFLAEQNRILKEKEEKAQKEGTAAFLTPQDKLLKEINKLQEETQATMHRMQMRTGNGSSTSDDEIMDWMRQCVKLGEMEAELKYETHPQ